MTVAALQEGMKPRVLTPEMAVTGGVGAVKPVLLEIHMQHPEAGPEVVATATVDTGMQVLVTVLIHLNLLYSLEMKSEVVTGCFNQKVPIILCVR